MCENDYPKIGQPKQKIIDFVKYLKSQGHYIGLWTCRVDSLLNEAVNWCKEQGIEFDAVNENLPERIEKWGNDCRKVGFDWIIDDKNINLDDIEDWMFKRCLI